MLLTELGRQIIALSDLPREKCPAAVRAMMPDLVELAGNEEITVDTRVSLLTRALRSLHPAGKRWQEPARALREVQEALVLAELGQ